MSDKRFQGPAIRVEGLVKTFGSLRALDGLDLTVGAGQIHGFLGPNGAGKSTTIRILLGMYRRDGGTVSIGGLDPERDSAAITRATAYVPGEVALWPGLTGAQTLEALAALRGARDRGRENELVEAFSLDPSKPVRSYSKGNRQKVMLVAALAAPCDLLVLDEPTSGLDPLQAEVFVAAVRRAAHDGRTVLMSSHIMAEVDRLCEAVTIIKDGRCVEAGQMTQLRHLRASRITCLLAPATAPGRSSPPGTGPDRGTSRQVEQLLGRADAQGRLSATVPAELVPRALSALVDAGAWEITCSPVSLDEVFLHHYEAAPR